MGIVSWYFAPILALSALVAMAQGQTTSVHEQFDFGSADPNPAFTCILPDTAYDRMLGYGFDLGTRPDSGKPFYFSLALPEGNYKVTVTLGDAAAESTTTVKAQSRRLMLEQIHTAPGEFQVRSFLVNLHNAPIGGGAEKLILEFSGTRPSLRDLEIQSVDAVTVYCIGDSSACDPINEPYGSWAQNLSRWFKPAFAIANYASPGQTLKSFRASSRWDTVLSRLRGGDYVFIQFGLNDMKKTGSSPFIPNSDFSQTHADANTEYKALLERYAAEAKGRGATPVILSPQASVTLGGSVKLLGDYPAAAAAAAAANEVGCPFIDLNKMSAQVFAALDSPKSGRGFVDDANTDTYGGYLLSRCVVEGIKQAQLDLAQYLTGDAGTFDPAHPTPPPSEFSLPPDPRLNTGQ